MWNTPARPLPGLLLLLWSIRGKCSLITKCTKMYKITTLCTYTPFSQMQQPGQSSNFWCIFTLLPPSSPCLYINTTWRWNSRAVITLYVSYHFSETSLSDLRWLGLGVLELQTGLKQLLILPSSISCGNCDQFYQQLHTVFINVPSLAAKGWDRQTPHQWK